MREMTVLILVVGREKLLNRTCSSRCTCYFHPGRGGEYEGIPYYGLYKKTLPKGQVSFSDLRYSNP